MTVRFAAAFAEAGRLWRAERSLLLPLAGVFYFVPMLGLVLLVSGTDFPLDGDPEQVRAAVMAFYQAHLLPILLVNLLIDFGSFAVMNLFLQGGGRTLGEVLALALRRFPIFVVIDLLASTAFALGFSLFILPGAFLFARSWLVGPAYAAAPDQGLAGVFRQGWTRSGGLNWLIILLAAAVTMLAGFFAVAVAGQLLGAIAAGSGAGVVLAIVAQGLTAAIGAATWTALSLLRVAFYRLSAPIQGM